jgi:hypothetical protein
MIKNESEFEIQGLIMILISRRQLFLVTKMMIEYKGFQIRFGSASFIAVYNRILISFAWSAIVFVKNGMENSVAAHDR